MQFFKRFRKYLITSKDQTDGNKQKIPFYKYVEKDLELKQQPPQYDVLEHPNLKVFCEECQRNITIDTIVMAYGSLQLDEQYEKQQLDLARLYCVGCFANLSVFPQRYTIRKSLKCTFTNSRWNLFDEVSLLNSLQIWGFGNWNQIKDFMDYNGSTFSVQQIQSHYEQVYLKRNGNDIKTLTQNNQPIANKKQTIQQIQHKYYFSCLYKNDIQEGAAFKMVVQQPQQPYTLKRQRENSLDERLMSRLQQKCQNNQLFQNIQKPVFEQENQDDQNQDQNDQNQNEQNQPQSLTVQLKPRSSFMNMQKIQGQAQKKNHSGKGIASSANLESQRNFNSATQKQKGNNIYSYNPKRRQFQILEYDYYAESMLAYLQFYEGDSQQEVNLKIEVIRQYNKRLDQRKKRRQFVIEHRLLDNHFHFSNIRNIKLGVKKFQAFRRFTLTLQEYEQLLKLYGEQVKLKRIIQGLKKLRSIGEKGKVKQILGYIQKKKQKKMLLGGSQKHNLRKIYQNQKDCNSISKKLILVGKSQSLFNDLKINLSKRSSSSTSNINLKDQDRQFNLAPSQIDYLQRKINLQNIQQFHIGNFKVSELKKKVNRFQSQKNQ